jgi:2-oxoisovalerate dehydrogenase E1 component
LRLGDKITIITTQTMVDLCCQLVDKMRISADLLDLRTLSQRDVDYAAIEESVKKTGRVVIVEQTTRGTSFGSLIADEIQRRFFDYLDQPVKRVTGKWAPPVVSQALEKAALAGSGDVEMMLREMFADSGLQFPLGEPVSA